MGGEITLQSVIGTGSRFTLTLPRSAEESEFTRVRRGRGDPPFAPSRVAAVDARVAALVLVVEDNEDNLFTLRQILATLSVELQAATSGREAIEYCRRRRPDLILMDMQMPGMSGLQATGAIRALPGGPTIPIIALTAQARQGDRERILAAGCDDYLSKPIEPKVLLAAIQRLLSRRGDNIDGRGRTGTAEEEEHGAHTAGR
jgi:CheY-like chemotaxis protein